MPAVFLQIDGGGEGNGFQQHDLLVDTGLNEQGVLRVVTAEFL